MPLRDLISSGIFYLAVVISVISVPVGVDAQTSGASSQSRSSATIPAGGTVYQEYKLGAGDKIRINVFGQTDLNGDYQVDGAGNIQLPLVGLFKVAGGTVGDLQKELVAKLSDGYFVNPSVSVEVVNYRPFYIMGQVSHPGEYPYVSGMSILNAVALAGGYTSRADETEAYIRRGAGNKEMQVPSDDSSKVEPGDIIRVPERFF
jgi:protein involved in polysaccharide export with SLBB domain